MQNKTHIRNELNLHDPNFVDQIMPYFGFMEKYFRYETVGLDHIPDKGPLLIVMNHGIIPYHGFLLTKKLVENYKIYPRALGAGFLFSIPWVKDFFLKGGVVNANNHNAKELLKLKNMVMLAPGGIYEGLVSKPGMKRIPWERRKGFVKLACEMNVPIIPTYCDGINEVYYNSDFLLKMRIKFLEATRFSMPLFCGIGPLPFPKKLVHFIGKPIKTTRKKGESLEAQVNRIHQMVLDSMKRMV